MCILCELTHYMWILMYKSPVKSISSRPVAQKLVLFVTAYCFNILWMHLFLSLLPYSASFVQHYMSLKRFDPWWILEFCLYNVQDTTWYTSTCLRWQTRTGTGLLNTIAREGKRSNMLHWLNTGLDVRTSIWGFAKAVWKLYKMWWGWEHSIFVEVNLLAQELWS